MSQPVARNNLEERPDISAIGGASSISMLDGSEANDRLVERVIGELNTICKIATFDFATSVGALIIERFYDGSLDGWRQRGPKVASLRTLARHPQLPMSPVSLYRSIAIYELCERLGVRRWRHCCTSHLRAVLSLPCRDQERLLQMAESGNWTVRHLEREAALLQPNRALRGGRKRDSVAVKVTRHLERTVCMLERLKLESGLEIPDIEPVLSGVITDIRQACSELSSYLPQKVGRAGA